MYAYSLITEHSQQIALKMESFPLNLKGKIVRNDSRGLKNT